MVEEVRIDGLRELDRKLVKLGSQAGFKALRAAMMKSSTPMFKMARANALATGIKGQDAGATAAAMGRWSKKTKQHEVTLWLGPKNKNKKALALWNAKHGKEVKRLTHFHLVEFGSINGPAQPFLRPAFAANARGYIAGFGAELRRAIEKVAMQNA
jgi:HK97 gp10 family phage protein